METLKGLYSNNNGDVFKLKETLPSGDAYFYHLEWIYKKGWVVYEKPVFMSKSDILELRKH